jgi:hypothetical protein
VIDGTMMSASCSDNIMKKRGCLKMASSVLRWRNSQEETEEQFNGS